METHGDIIELYIIEVDVVNAHIRKARLKIARLKLRITIIPSARWGKEGRRLEEHLAGTSVAEQRFFMVVGEQ